MPDLRAFLERTFAMADGVLPFDAFMAKSLYDPDHGYYSAAIADVGGRRGDFATAATLSDGLGRSVAGWILQEIDHHGWRGPVHVIEIGGGNGSLAASVLKSLGWWRRRQVRYHLVEVSPVLRGLQQQRLGRSANWHESIAEALRVIGGTALIFSNELVDAFPAKWLRWDGESWREVCVGFERESGLREIFRELPPELNSRDFSAMALADPVDGQRVEILPSYRHWLEDLARSWREGSMLTIDYGGTSAAEIYARRPEGTMRAYFRHERIGGRGIYSRFGKQDLTADVNFADLVFWGEGLGFGTVGLGTQAEFLGRHGGRHDRMAGEGAGAAFFVLEQRKSGRSTVAGKQKITG